MSNFLVIKKRDKIIAYGQLRSHENINKLSSLTVVFYHHKGIGMYFAKSLIEKSSTSIYLSGKVELESFYLSLGFNRVCWFDLPYPIKLEFSLYLIVAIIRNKSIIFMKQKNNHNNILQLEILNYQKSNKLGKIIVR